MVTPATVQASGRFPGAMTAVTGPSAATAACRTGTRPRTGRSWPSRPSSAANTHRRSAPALTGRVPAAARTATAIGRSRPQPCRSALAGGKLMVMAPVGQSSPLFSTAARTRSRASRKLIPGTPETPNAGAPSLMAARTWISSARVPGQGAARMGGGRVR